MKNSYLINPFQRIAGAKALLIGFMGYLTISYFSFITGTHHYGIFNINFAKGYGFSIYLLETGFHWFILSSLLLLSGLILSRSRIRLIDIFGTLLMAKLPLLVTPIARLIPYFQSFAIYSTAMFIVVGIYTITLLWTLILSFNAYKVSCNLKNERLIISFILSIILSEIATKIIILKLT